MSRPVVQACAVPAMLLALGLGSALCLGEYDKGLVTSALIVGLGAYGVQVLYAHGGELSFGHGVFFGVGAYSYAIFAQTDSVVGLLAACAIGVVAGVCVAGVVSLLLFRTVGLSYTLATLCLAEFSRFLFASLYGTTEGDNGIHGLAVPDHFRGDLGLFVVTLCTIATLLLGQVVARTRVGQEVNGLRQSPVRLQCFGLNPAYVRFKVRCFSAVPTGLAGVLYAAHEGGVHPDLFGWVTSGDFIAMVLLGGSALSIGPFVGSTILVVGKTHLVPIWDHWPLVLGVLLLSCAVLFPEGIAGTAIRIARSWQRHSLC